LALDMVEARSVETRAKPSWLVPAILLVIVAAGASVAWLDPWIVALAGQQKALLLERAAEGGPLGYAAAGLHAAAWAGLVILLRPMLLLALVVLIESWLTPDVRAQKDRLLAWTVRGLFFVVGYMLSVVLGRYLSFMPGPLFDFTDAGSPAGLHMLQTALLFLLSMLATDFCQYWAHRAYHRFPLLWKFHAIHHAPRNLDALHKFEHPIEGLTSWFLIALPVNMLIAGVDATQLGMLAAFFLVQTHLVHMNAPVHLGPLRWLLVDNRFHFIHHSRQRRHYDKNFAAVFPLLDRLFGTYCPPEGDTLPATGLDSHLPPSKLSHFLLASLPPDVASGTEPKAPPAQPQPLGLQGTSAA
jgi:sterol desaturase/sphingolipid hydroxylase (fatty acid hydroxylase superfamily)